MSLGQHLLQVLKPVSASGDPTGMPVTSGLLYRWNAAQGVTTSAGLVTQWNDQASTNHVYSSGYSPTYVSSFDRFNGKPSIRFAAGNVLAGTSLTPIYGNANRTVVAIVRTINAGDATYGDNIISQSDAPIARYNAGSWPYYYPVALSTRGIHGWDPVPDYLPSEMPTKATQCIIWTHASTGTATTLRRNGAAVGGATLNFTENQGYTVIGKGMQNSGHDIDADYADLLVFNRVLNSTEISQIEAWAQSYYNIDYSFDKVSLLLHMDGANGSTTFTDSSSNALSITANGDAKISTAQTISGFGQSAYFDGNDWISIASNSAMAFSTGAFSVEFWIRLDSIPASGSRIIMYTGNQSGSFILRLEPSTGYLFCERNFTSTNEAKTTVGLSAATWQHVAVTRDASSVMRIFIDGVQRGSGTVTSDYNQGGSFVGSTSTGTQGLAMYIDDLRVTKGVARYTANFTPSGPFPNS